MLYEKCNQGAEDGMISWKEATDCGAPASMKAEFMNTAGEDKKINEQEFLA